MNIKLSKCSMNFDYLKIIRFRNSNPEFKNLFRYVTRKNGKPVFIYGCAPDFVPDELKWNGQIEVLKYLLIEHLNN